MGRSLSFGSTTYDIVALLRLGFPVAPRRRRLAKPQTVTRRFIMRKARRHPFRTRRCSIGLRLLVSTWFQVLLTPLKGVLFIVLSPYLYTIGRDVVLSLGGWAPLLHAGFHEHRATLVRQPLWSVHNVAYGTITLYREPFQTL